MEQGQVIDTFGEIIAALASFAGKVPAKSFMAIPSGIRPTLEAVETYEDIVYKFRDGAGPTYKPIPPLFVDSLEAFEAGRVYDAVPPLLLALEHLVQLHKEEKVNFTSPERDRIREFQRRLEKILPDTKKPEIDMPTPEIY
jgi:hypothetical protein